MNNLCTMCLIVPFILAAIVYLGISERRSTTRPLPPKPGTYPHKGRRKHKRQRQVAHKRRKPWVDEHGGRR